MALLSLDPSKILKAKSGAEIASPDGQRPVEGKLAHVSRTVIDNARRYFEQLRSVFANDRTERFLAAKDSKSASAEMIHLIIGPLKIPQKQEPLHRAAQKAFNLSA